MLHTCDRANAFVHVRACFHEITGFLFVCCHLESSYEPNQASKMANSIILLKSRACIRTCIALRIVSHRIEKSITNEYFTKLKLLMFDSIVIIQGMHLRMHKSVHRKSRSQTYSLLAMANIQQKTAFNVFIPRFSIHLGTTNAHFYDILTMISISILFTNAWNRYCWADNMCIGTPEYTK